MRRKIAAPGRMACTCSGVSARPARRSMAFEFGFVDRRRAHELSFCSEGGKIAYAESCSRGASFRVNCTAMIIDRIDPIALRLPNQPGAADALYLVLCKVTARSGLVGYGECLCLRPAMQQSLLAAIRDAIAPLFLGKSVGATGAPEPRSPDPPGLVRPRRDQSQCPGRRRHGAVGYRRQGGGSLALRPAGRRATERACR